MQRKKTHVVRIGSVPVGGSSPVAIQSMTKTKTKDIAQTVNQIKILEGAGCDIIRCAVPDMESVSALREIKEKIRIPLVADIHFNYELALGSIEAGADKIRINPGNIGSEKKVQAIIKKAKENDIAIRIGVNSGSLEKDILERYGSPCVEALIDSAERNVRFFESEGFSKIVLSIKSSDVPTMISVYREISDKIDYPLHLGVTEAGPPFRGVIKSSVGIGTLLMEGIGDTIRVSLTGDPEKEVEAAKLILKSAGLYERGIDIISCPTCGRLETDLLKIVSEVEKRVNNVDKKLKVAIMGCVVNGPGEAKEADVGVACGKGTALLFRKGEVVEKIREEEIIGRLSLEIEKWGRES